jgi:DNA-binding winged helix-turn-helix (wHTH) protein
MDGLLLAAFPDRPPAKPCHPTPDHVAVLSAPRPEVLPKFSERGRHEASLFKSSQHSIVVGDRTVDLARELVIDERGGVVPLRPRAWLVLRLLATRAGQLVAKGEILDEVWSDCEVTEDSLVQAIGDIRRALGETGRTALRTLPRRGYMLALNDELLALPRNRLHPQCRVCPS